MRMLVVTSQSGRGRQSAMATDHALITNQPLFTITL
ncbi:unnamed protein product [Acanthoscelides obtectus]|uniref:Uncharacterized protein n=1 Tax=Acanthoscelides obtectus TaxID=200917 RepID=A0A9P0P3I2_ACAOB|nr:unnamed protein product [Acanthoscelides obtectus]CAK1653179.1 hypothetical protein AOBTE_LOCUS18107 [Acanthoscelides obtectus]